MTDQIVSGARALIARVDELGGSVPAIESGFIQNEIEEAAYAFQRSVDEGTRRIVGINAYAHEENETIDLLPPNPVLEREQAQRLRDLKAHRDRERVESSLAELESAASSSCNLMYPLKNALSAYATIGEVSDALRRAFGTHDSAQSAQ